MYDLKQKRSFFSNESSTTSGRLKQVLRSPVREIRMRGSARVLPCTNYKGVR
jgi:hypothetical protein